MLVHTSDRSRLRISARNTVMPVSYTHLICELNALKKPNLLIPLSANASRGDQILNARSFERQGYSMVLEEEEITESTLLNSIRELYQNRQSYICLLYTSVKIQKASVSPKTARAARAFEKLLALGYRLLSVIKKNEGTPNKDLERFSREVQSLCCLLYTSRVLQDFYKYVPAFWNAASCE